MHVANSSYCRGLAAARRKGECDDLDIYGCYIEPPERILGVLALEHFAWSSGSATEKEHGRRRRRNHVLLAQMGRTNSQRQSCHSALSFCCECSGVVRYLGEILGWYGENLI